MESWMVDVAAEELPALEAEHPGRFDYLKQEIKAFVSQPPLQFFSAPSPPPADAANIVDTQASSTDDNRKRKRGVEGERRWKRRGVYERKDSADLALERAADCLRKIRRLKESLACW